MRIASRHLPVADLPCVMLASLRDPDAFTGPDGVLEGMLALHFLEIAKRINEGEPNAKRDTAAGGA